MYKKNILAKGIFTYVDENELKEQKERLTENELFKKLSIVWGKSGAGSPDTNKKMPYLYEVIDTTQNYTFEEVISIMNTKISTKCIADAKKMLLDELLKGEILKYKVDVFEKQIDMFIYLKVIYETYIGYKNENAFYNHVSNFTNVIKVEKTTGYADTYYGVDFIVHRNDGTKFNIQVKPASFMYIKNQNVINNAKQKLEEFSNKNGGEYLFAFCEEGRLIARSKDEINLKIGNVRYILPPFTNFFTMKI